MFLLKILFDKLDFWKCCFNNFRYVLPIFALTFREKDGLKQIILGFHYLLLQLSLAFVFGVKTKGLLNPLFFNASKHIDVAFQNIFDKRLQNCFWMVRAIIDV